MNDPIRDIENKQANIDMGKLAALTFKGAREEADTWSEAFWATVAYFTAMFK